MARFNPQVVDFCLPVVFDSWLELRVAEGDEIKGGDVLAVGDGKRVREVNVASALGLEGGADVSTFLVKSVGERIEKGEVLAKKGMLMGKRTLVARDAGVLERIENGVVTLVEQLDDPKEIIAPVSGRVTSLIEGMLEITLKCHQLSGGYGWGNLRWGELLSLPVVKDEMRLEFVDEDVRGKVVVLSGKLYQAMWFKLATLGAAGVICGGVPSTFESWGMRSDSFPALLTVGDDPDVLPEDELKWLEKQDGKLAFVLAESGELVVEK